jgi:hypothetical protein
MYYTLSVLFLPAYVQFSPTETAGNNLLKYATIFHLSTTNSTAN